MLKFIYCICRCIRHALILEGKKNISECVVFNLDSHHYGIKHQCNRKGKCFSKYTVLPYLSIVEQNINTS